MPGEVDRDALLQLDRQFVWHPYTAMDDYVAGRVAPLVIDRAEGAWLFDRDGRRYLDGNSSWWVASLGHRHPRLVRALLDQAGKLAHTALAGLTHEPAVRLAQELVEIAPAGLSRVLFSDDGSTAVETALKLAVQFWAQNGQPTRRRIVALEGAFHGDTAGATALGGVELFRRPFAPLLVEPLRLPSPADGEEHSLEELSRLLTTRGDEIAALIVEPMVQGAAGMRCHGASYLRGVRELTRAHDVLLIADEVFTGLGRTGTMWACQHAGITPDLLCTAKALGGGMLPFAATLVTDRIFRGFLGGKERAFWHGHSFTGNPLGAAVAREVLAVYRDEEILVRASRKAERLATLAADLAKIPGVRGARHLGMIAAFDLAGGGYLGGAGWQVYEEGLRRGAYLRPLGDTVYLTPPLNIAEGELDELCEIFAAAVATGC